MSFLKNRLVIPCMLLLCWALAASMIAAHYSLVYADFLNRVGGVAIRVNIGVNRNDGTGTEWSNATKALTGMTLFKVTRNLANVSYNTAAGFGVYVTSIDGLAFNATHGWVWWKWDTGMMNWTLVLISSDAYAVADSETLLWFYESGWPPAPP